MTQRVMSKPYIVYRDETVTIESNGFMKVDGKPWGFLQRDGKLRVHVPRRLSCEECGIPHVDFNKLVKLAERFGIEENE